MKKLFTLIAAALMVAGANAQTKLSVGAGWNTTIEDVVLKGNVAFNYTNAYATVFLDVDEIDLTKYPSYEVLVSAETPMDKLQWNVGSDKGEGWSGNFAAGTTTLAGFIPEGATKLTKAGIQACNVADLGKVEFLGANLIDADGKKTAVGYKMPETWAASVLTPITSATINFTEGGQYNYAAVTGFDGLKNQKITIEADKLPANCQLKIKTKSRNTDNDAIYAPFAGGETTFSVDVEAADDDDVITEIAIQNTEKQDPFKIAIKSITATPLSSAAGVSAVKAAAADNDAALYNLAGQKVAKNYKGIVVKNGKKFVNK